MSFLLNIISTTAAAVTLQLVAIWLLRAWITERLKNAIKHEYDREIEAYRSMLALVHSATAEGQKAAIEARMHAFDRVWKAILELRNKTGGITLFFDVLTSEEYKTLNKNKQFIEIVGTLDNAKIQGMMPDPNIEEARPYVGEIVWSYFFAYQAFNIRLVLLAWLSNLNDDDNNKINWHCDTATRRVLAVALTPGELARLDALEIGKISYARQTIESKILKSWWRLISGEEFGDEAFKHSQAILEAVNRSELK